MEPTDLLTIRGAAELRRGMVQLRDLFGDAAGLDGAPARLAAMRDTAQRLVDDAAAIERSLRADDDDADRAPKRGRGFFPRRRRRNGK